MPTQWSRFNNDPADHVIVTTAYRVEATLVTAGTKIIIWVVTARGITVLPF